MTNEQIAGCVGIIKAHSIKEQEDKAIEEMAELTKAILKSRHDKGTIEEIVDELADVRIMLEQLILIYDCREAVNDRVCYKIDRQLERDEGENNEM